MKKLVTQAPKDVWKFFSDLEEKSGAFLMLGKQGLALEETDDMSEPPNIASDDKVTRADWIVFLKVLVALRGGRPVKIIPAGKTQLRVFVGPKP